MARMKTEKENNGLTVHVKISDLEWFELFLNEIKNMCEDERMNDKLRNEYVPKLKKITDAMWNA
jgi:hypothetical protein